MRRAGDGARSLSGHQEGATGVGAAAWLAVAFALLFPPVAVFVPRASTVLLALAAAVVLADGRARRAAVAAVPKPAIGLLGGLAGWAAVSLAWAPAPGEAAWLWARMVVLAAAGALVVGAFSRLTRPGAFETALAVGLAFFLVVFAEELATGGLLVTALTAAWTAATPWVAAPPNSGTLLGQAATGLAVYAWPAVAAIARRFGRTWALAAALAVLAVLVLQPVLAAFVGGLAAALVFALALGAPRLAGAAVIAGLAAINLVAAIAARLGLAASTALPVSWRERLHILDFVLGKIGEAPILDWGFDAARHLGQDVIGPFAGNRLIPLHPHNGWMQIWLELGLPGLAVTAAIVGWLVLAAGPRQTTPEGRAAAIAATAAFAVVAGISFGIWQSWWLAVAWSGAALSAAIGATGRGDGIDGGADTESV